MNLSSGSNSPKTSFIWASGLNLEKLNTILSGTNHIFTFKLNLNSASGYIIHTSDKALKDTVVNQSLPSLLW